MKHAFMLVLALMLTLCGVSAAMAKEYALNDQAQEITLIQQALEELDFYYADITGKFGTRTQAAVRKFQKRYGLPQTGIADDETRAQLYAKAGIDAPQGIEQEKAASDYGSETLREGSSGDAVRMLQENLTLLEYYSGSVTGSYGRLTKEAVRRFQKENELSADGVAGPRTFKKLTEILVGQGTQEAPVISLPGAGTMPASVSLKDVSLLNTEWTLRRTSSSGYVKRLQQALAALGYDPGSADGRFGEKTENAVKTFQTIRGLEADGVAGRATLRQINEDIRNGVTMQTAGID